MKIAFVDITNKDLALQLIRKGGGILPQACRITETPPGVRFIPVDGWTTTSYLFFIFSKENTSGALKRLEKCVREYIANE